MTSDTLNTHGTSTINKIKLGSDAKVNSLNIHQGKGDIIQAGQNSAGATQTDPASPRPAGTGGESAPAIHPAPDIFISHITAESRLARVLKNWIDSTLLGHYRTFVSNDAESIQPGDRWLHNIEKAISSSRVMVVLLSPQSLSRPWINFEAGGGWMRGLRLLLLCHSGLSVSNLPAPYSYVQALEMKNDDFPALFFQTLAKEFGIPTLPRIHAAEMRHELLRAIE